MYRLFLIFSMLKAQPQSQSSGFGNNHTQFIRSGLLHTPASHIIIKSGSILHLLSGMRYQYSSTDNSSGSYYRWDSDRPRSTFSRQRDNPTAYRHRTKTNSYAFCFLTLLYISYRGTIRMAFISSFVSFCAPLYRLKPFACISSPERIFESVPEKELEELFPAVAASILCVGKDI